MEDDNFKKCDSVYFNEIVNGVISNITNIDDNRPHLSIWKWVDVMSYETQWESMGTLMGYQIPILPPPQRLSPKLKDAIQSLGVIPTSDGNEVRKEDDIEKEFTKAPIEKFKEYINEFGYLHGYLISIGDKP